ncbi:hypothetical protein Vadar_030430 [Vaccinium darrowii]|uniref:Uncharacterized protein n=1 Tax=Vaccinium darrowii TaxID=229202 RepID=A0ACB7XVC0_9ERIC|nr:hypothetical protein Vadar_030430 [Vaccinium darrowii]
MAPNELPDLNRPPQEDEQLTHKVQEQQQEEENQNEKQSEQQTEPESEPPHDEEEENQNEKQSEQQTVPESESPQDEEEEVVKDTTCVSDDQTMTTPCVPDPSTPTTPPPATREPPHPHCSSHPDKYCGFETLFFASYSDTHFGSPAASGFVTEPSCEPIEDVVSPQPEKPTSSKRRLIPVFGKNADESREKRKAKAVEEEEAAKKKKKKKKKPSAGAATRVWSEEDEVVILKGLMNFQPKKGSDSCQDHWGELYELIKKSLSDDFSKSQFTDKIYKLRRKYRKNAYKGERADEHEHECFELSKRIWGGGGGGRAMSTRARKTVKQLDKSVALPEENGKEVAWKGLEKKWQIWSADEAALRLRLDELIEEQKKLMFDALKPSKGVRVFQYRGSPVEADLLAIEGDMRAGLMGHGRRIHDLREKPDLASPGICLAIGDPGTEELLSWQRWGEGVKTIGGGGCNWH